MQYQAPDSRVVDISGLDENHVSCLSVIRKLGDLLLNADHILSYSIMAFALPHCAYHRILNRASSKRRALADLGSLGAM